MKLKTSITLMIAVVLGLVTAKVGMDLMKKYRSGAVGLRVVVAKKDMEPGHVVTAEDLELKEMPASFVPAKAMREIKQAAGRTVLASVIKDYPLVDSQLAAVGAGAGLQASVPKGMRLVTVDVSESSGVAGLLVAGCKVDVIATLRNGEQSMARTIVQNVAVQFVQRGKGTSSSGRVNASASADNGPVKTVTLLVTPKQAVQIELANSSGKPRLVLRGNGDMTEEVSAQASQNELLGLPDEPVKVEAPPPATAPVVEVAAQPPPPEPKKEWKVQFIKNGKETTVTMEDTTANGEPNGDGTGAATAAEKVAPAAGDERTLTGTSPAKAPAKDAGGTLQ